MSFSLSTIGSFELQDSGILLQKAVLGSDLVNYVEVKPGYPNASVSINVLGGTAGFTGGVCGWTDAGSINFTQISVSNDTYQWQQSLCLDDLRDTWISTQMQASAFGEELPFEQAIADYVSQETQKYAESVVGSQFLSAITTVTAGGTGGTAAFTSSNAYAQALELIDALPLDVQNMDDLHMYMSYASFRALTTNLVANNFYHYDPGVTTGTGLGQSLMIPGTGVKAVPVGGFGTSTKVICGPKKHVVWVCGLVDDSERIEAWYSRDNQEFRMLSRFTSGLGALAESFSVTAIP